MNAGNVLAQFLPLVVFVLIFYFLFIRPQQTRAKRHKEMIESLQKGDKIVTSGGFIVEIVSSEEEFLRVRLNDETIARLSKEYVARKMDEEQATSGKTERQNESGNVAKNSKK